MQWLCLVLVGLKTPPVLAALQWWTTRGVFASHRRCEEGWWLGRCMHAWGRRVVHVFDRGFAGEPWLEECMQYQIRCVMRWPKGYLLRDFRWIKRKAWQITRGKRSQWKRQLYTRHLNAWVQGGVVVVPVTHPAIRGQFWLVVSRPGKGQLPWYLLTNEPVETEEDAWQIEMTWRYTKSELGEDPPSALDVAGAGQTTPACQFGLGLSLILAGSQLPGRSGSSLAPVVSSHRSAISPGGDTALSGS
jgi:hypothetical protein